MIIIIIFIFREFYPHEEEEVSLVLVGWQLVESALKQNYIVDKSPTECDPPLNINSIQRKIDKRLQRRLRILEMYSHYYSILCRISFALFSTVKLILDFDQFLILLSYTCDRNQMD